jgi:serine/threonine protein kinase
MAFSLRDFVDIKKIAEGGMGNVFVATQVSLGRKVVIKEMSLSTHKDAKLIRRFENEAKSAAALDHENIIQVFDFGADNGSFYISMEYLDGWDLEKIMHWDPFPKEIGIMILVKALKGLEYAHQQGTVHCDVKPANILVSKTGKVKVVDFGLAHAGTRAADFAESSSVYITPAYMPPEVANGGEGQGSSPDIWSAGVVAYKIVGGHLPFAADTVRTMVYSIVNAKEKDIQQLCPALPDDCADAIRVCLQKNPNKRPLSLDGMINSFGNYLYDLGVRDSDRMIVKYVQDKVGAATELKALCAAYHGRKAKGYLDSGNTRKSEIHFREAERFGGVGLEEGSRSSDTKRMPNAWRETTSRRTNPITWLRTTVVKARTKTAITVLGILGVVLLGVTSISMVVRKDRFDPVRAVGVSTARDTSPGLQKDLFAQKGSKDSFSEYTAPGNNPTDVKQLAKKSDEATGIRVHKQQESQPGILKLTVDPPRALVNLDGENLSDKDLASGKRVKPGKHTIAAAATGYKSYSAIIAIEAKTVQNVAISLKQLEEGAGFLHVHSYPWADVYVDGADEGTAPMANPLMLPEGDHTVVLKREGYKPFSSTVHVVEGEVVRLKVQLDQETHTAAINQESGSE